MTRRLAILASLAAAAAVAVSASALAGTTHTTTGLQGEVGPGFTIELKRAGKDVKTLKPGTYRLLVEDKSSIHNFHLKGPGVNKVVTTVAFVGKKTVTVRLKRGTYTFQCDPHAASGMKGTFRVR